MQYIDRILSIWGKFANSRIGTEYPCVSAGMNLAVEPSEYSIFSLDDETCLKIGELILKLRDKNDYRYEIIIARYALRLDDNVICDVLHISRTTYFRELSKAQSYLEGAIDEAEIFAYFYA